MDKKKILHYYLNPLAAKFSESGFYCPSWDVEKIHEMAELIKNKKVSSINSLLKIQLQKKDIQAFSNLFLVLLNEEADEEIFYEALECLKPQSIPVVCFFRYLNSNALEPVLYNYAWSGQLNASHLNMIVDNIFKIENRRSSNTRAEVLGNFLTHYQFLDGQQTVVVDRIALGDYVMVQDLEVIFKSLSLTEKEKKTLLLFSCSHENVDYLLKQNIFPSMAELQDHVIAYTMSRAIYNHLEPHLKVQEEKRNLLKPLPSHKPSTFKVL